MKAKDLMIGDWVSIPTDFDGKERKPTQISKIEEGKTYNLIEPIPLTKKILKENGFREDENGHYEYWGDEDDNLWIQVQFDKYDETPICYNIQTPHNGRLFEMVDSVHELQHAFRLGGIEKEIKL